MRPVLGLLCGAMKRDPLRGLGLGARVFVIAAAALFVTLSAIAVYFAIFGDEDQPVTVFLRAVFIVTFVVTVVVVQFRFAFRRHRSFEEEQREAMRRVLDKEVLNEADDGSRRD